VRLVQLLANVPKAQNTANRENHPLRGTPECQAKKELNVGMMAEDVTPADYIRALARELALCMETFSV
jgi:translation initiation factor 2B subunit (eIF-2B alpha/beta/delta family)